MLDLEPIRALLIESDAEAVELIPRDAELDEWWDSYSRLGHGAVLVRGPEGTVPPLAFFMANAPAYVAALLAEVERLRSELTGLRTYLTRSIADDLAGELEALEVLDGLADEDMATVDGWIAAMSPRCRHDAELERLRSELAKVAPRFIVRLEPGVWAAEGDPERTTVKASAKRFPTERSARRALSKARRFRAFPKAVVECVP